VHVAFDDIVRVDPLTGVQSVISASTDPNPDGIYVDSNGFGSIAVDSNRDVLLPGCQSPCSENTGIVRIHPATGQRSFIPLSDRFGPSPTRGIAVAANGDIFAATTNGLLLHVNHVTGEIQNTRYRGLFEPRGIAVDGDDHVFVANGNFTLFPTLIEIPHALDASSFARVLSSTPGAVPLDPPDWGDTIAVALAGTDVIASDNGFARIVRVNPANGMRTVIFESPPPDDIDPLGLAVDENGDILVAAAGSPSGVIRINPTTKEQTVVSPTGLTLAITLVP